MVSVIMEITIREVGMGKAMYKAPLKVAEHHAKLGVHHTLTGTMVAIVDATASTLIEAERDKAVL